VPPRVPTDNRREPPFGAVFLCSGSEARRRRRIRRYCRRAALYKDLKCANAVVVFAVRIVVEQRTALLVSRVLEVSTILTKQTSPVVLNFYFALEINCVFAAARYLLASQYTVRAKASYQSEAELTGSLGALGAIDFLASRFARIVEGVLHNEGVV
jgi:hypothetical protein